MSNSMLDNSILEEHLEKLERIIDLEHIERTKLLQEKAFIFDKVSHIPTVIEYPLEDSEWRTFSFEEIFSDPGKMLLNELSSVYRGAKLQDDRLYGIRANYGTGIIASMFGCKVETFDHALPIGLHIDEKRLSKVIDDGVPSFDTGIISKVYDTALYFKETLSSYPKLSEYVQMQLFDIQGTFDNASIIWGSEIFIAFYDEPDKLHKLLKIITETIRATVYEFRRITGTPLDEHGGCLNSLGAICLRNDSCINLSKEQYVEFVKPYDKELITEFTGWIHFCGKAHQWWQELLDIPRLKGINPFQGEFYDLCEMFEICEDSKIPIVQWTKSLNKESKEKIHTGLSCFTHANSYDDACYMRDKLNSTGHI